VLTKLPRWIWLGAAVLALSAGYVNAVALSGIASSAVSHISGTVTMALQQLANGELHDGLRLAAIVLAFLSGATLSGIVVKDETLKAGRRYGVALLVESVLLTTAAIEFGRVCFHGELWASVACGLQNAMVATYSGSVIRTTHLTGIVSDLGAALGNFLAGRQVSRLQVELHLSILFGFSCGVLLGAMAYQRFEYRAMFGPAGLIALSGLSYMLIIRPRANRS
jgi:uncharacterized membrane protein YoaK (UPF0700 family)